MANKSWLTLISSVLHDMHAYGELSGSCRGNKQELKCSITLHSGYMGLVKGIFKATVATGTKLVRSEGDVATVYFNLLLHFNCSRDESLGKCLAIKLDTSRVVWRLLIPARFFFPPTRFLFSHFPKSAEHNSPCHSARAKPLWIRYHGSEMKCMIDSTCIQGSLPITSQFVYSAPIRLLLVFRRP